MSIDYTEIDECDVYKGDVRAGSLRRDRDDIVFAYTNDYLASDLPAVATTLPKRKDPVRTSGGAVPPFFAGLLPEGRRLEALRAELKTSTDDDLSQLLAVGRDCIGDVRVFPSGSDVPIGASFERAIGEPSEISFREMFETSLGHPFRSPSVPGVQDKISDAMLSLPTRHRGEAVILKLTPSGLPHLVENESFFLSCARQCGLDTPTHSVITDRDGESGLVVSRFDRHSDQGQLTRIAQEDAAQVAGRWPAAKYTMSSREVFESMTSVAPAAQVAAAKLLRLFVFSYAIANGDLHAKNVSIYHRQDFWEVTPAYDLVSTLPYGDDRMALQLEGRKSNITGSTFVAFSARLGTKEKASRRIVLDVADRLEPTVHELESIGFDDRQTEHLRKTIAARIDDLRRMN